MVIDFQGHDREILVDSNEFVSRNDLKIQVPPPPPEFSMDENDGFQHEYFFSK